MEQVALFIDTNLGTHLVVSASPNSTVRHFKRQLEQEHVKYFPHCGEIRVCGLMVKQKSLFYHLAESMLIKHAFQGKKGTWFLHMEAKKFDGGMEGASKSMTANGKFRPNSVVVGNPPKDEKQQLITNNNEQHKQQDNGKKCPFIFPLTTRDSKDLSENKEEEEKSQHLMNKDRNGATASSQVSSPILSVTTIINRYFPTSMYESSLSNSDDTIQSMQVDVDSVSHTRISGSHKQSKPNRISTFSSPLHNAKTRTGKLRRLEVGKRLVIAADSLIKSSRSKKRLLSSLQGFKEEKLRRSRSSSLVRKITFDISDSD